MDSPAAPVRRFVATFDRALLLGAAVLTASMLVSALHDVSQAWDVGYYHLPFAARLGGVLPADVYVFDRVDQARFEGFPLFAEVLQGALWRITGRAETTNLVAFAAVPLLAWFLKQRFSVPMHLSLIAFFAVPLVQLHATSSYVDLPANTAAAVLVLVALDVWSKSELVMLRTWLVALAAAAIAANTKALSHPVVALSLVALGVRALLALRDARDTREASDSAKSGEARTRARRAMLVAAVLLPLVFFTPLKNLARHGNPYYPIQTSVFGHVLQGIEPPYDSSPVWLEHAPRPARFVCSLLEIGLRPMTSRRRWTVDQWMPEGADGLRMGGFFSAYVVFQLAWLVRQIVREKTRAARVVAIGFSAFTLVVSCMPQSHELRYYMDWMLVLVACNLWLTCRAARPSENVAFGAVASIALGVVLFVTKCGYVLPSGSTFDELVREKVDTRALVSVHDGDHVCIDQAPWTVLWAAPFHAPQRYVVQEAEAKSDCAGMRAIQ